MMKMATLLVGLNMNISWTEYIVNSRKAHVKTFARFFQKEGADLQAEFPIQLSYCE